ncbi:MAG TPA: hypothetical protein VF223_22815 [Trebonia sp.]
MGRPVTARVALTAGQRAELQQRLRLDPPGPAARSCQSRHAADLAGHDGAEETVVA